MTEAGCSPEEFLISAMARELEGAGHIAVGALSPIPGSAALLAREIAQQEAPGEAVRPGVSPGNKTSGASPDRDKKQEAVQVSITQGEANNPFTDGGRELFDCAGQGRVDVFFLGGAQIDGGANINLLGTGAYPDIDKRFPGSFGSAFMYFVVPKVILFAPEHSSRVLVERVDFISAPGTSPPEVNRPGGPKVLITGRAVMSFDAEKARFRLESVHPGQTAADIRDNTGFDFDAPRDVPETPAPEPERLHLLRSVIGREIGKTYPEFAERVFRVGALSVGPGGASG